MAKLVSTREVGFVIDNSASHGSPNLPFAIAITSTKGGAA